MLCQCAWMSFHRQDLVIFFMTEIGSTNLEPKLTRATSPCSCLGGRGQRRPLRSPWLSLRDRDPAAGDASLGLGAPGPGNRCFYCHTLRTTKRSEPSLPSRSISGYTTSKKYTRNTDPCRIPEPYLRLKVLWCKPIRATRAR